LGLNRIYNRASAPLYDFNFLLNFGFKLNFGLKPN